jgi:hypothetical protein
VSGWTCLRTLSMYEEYVTVTCLVGYISIMVDLLEDLVDV